MECCKDKRLVSVVMPVYNGAEFLREAIDSILSQTYSNIEFIVINDGSNDEGECENIIYSYGDKIRYFYKPNGGVASALNYGIKMAKGHYIARMDADDIAMPNRIREQVCFMENNLEIGVCGAGYQCIDRNGRAREKIYCPESDGEIRAELLFLNVISHPTVMIRRDLFDQGWVYDESKAAEDYDLWTRMILTVRFANISQILLKHRVNEKSVTGTQRDKIQESATIISKSYVEKLFLINGSVFDKEDFCPSCYCPHSIQEWDKFIIRQFSLLYYIYEQNNKLHIIDMKQIVKVLNARWKWAFKWRASFLGTERCLHEYSGSDFLIFCDLIADEEDCFIDQLKKRYECAAYEELCQALQCEVMELRQQYISFCRQKKRFAICGMGKSGKVLINKYRKLCEKNILEWDLCALTDKNIKEMNLETVISTSYPLMALDKIKKLELDYLVISSSLYFSEIEQDLLGIGIDKNRILDADWMTEMMIG